MRRPRRPARPSSQPGTAGWPQLSSAWYACALVAATVVCYSNSLRGAFVLDDRHAILENPRVSDLADFDRWKSLRGLVDFSFAANHALGGFEPLGYHLLNLAIHCCTGLILFDLVRRTLAGFHPDEATARRAAGLAFLIAGLWSVHPLTTQAVDYVCQRFETLTAMFYLLGLYAFRRSQDERARRPEWSALVIVAYVLGLRSKETILTFPVVLLWYDRTFVAADWSAIWQRKKLYAALVVVTAVCAGTFLLPVLNRLSGEVLTRHAPVPRLEVEESAIVVEGLTPWTYLASQPGVILYYLRLALWPVGQCFDYVWQPVAAPSEAVFPVLAVLGLLAAIVWGALRGNRAAFLGGAFFLFLAPTSSIVPIRDLLVEHRMYLPLAAVVALVVLGGERLAVRSGTARLAAGAAGLIALALGTLTWQRNAVYESEESLWRDTCHCAPRNPRAQFSLGLTLNRLHRPQEALGPLRRTVEIDPNWAMAWSEFGLALAAAGQHEFAADAQLQVLRIDPADAAAHTNLGIELQGLGRRAEAEEHYRLALEIDPHSAKSHDNYANLLGDLGRLDEALRIIVRLSRSSPVARGRTRMPRQRCAMPAGPRKQRTSCGAPSLRSPPRRRCKMHSGCAWRSKADSPKPSAHLRRPWT